MKCLCGFNQRPDSVVVLKKHIEDCMLTGILADMTPDPVVVWRNRELTVTKSPDEDEATMDFGIVRPDASRLKLEKKVADAQAAVHAVIDPLASVEEILEATKDIVLPGEEAPKKKTTPKKKA